MGISFEQAPVPPLFFALGARGKTAEAVAEEAVDQAIAYRDAGAPVDPHSADQILLPLSLAAGPSEYRVSEITRHLTTNAAIIRMFLDRSITVEGEEGGPGVVRIADGVL